MPIRGSALPGHCALLLAHAALAQTCGQWVTGIGPGGTGGGLSGADNTITSMATWDRSAIGLPSLAVITGNFGVVGDQDTSPFLNGITPNAVAWDGQRWTILSPINPIDGSSVIALGTYQSQLICGKRITGGWQIASFDGTTWTSIGSPISCPTQAPLIMTVLGCDMFIGEHVCPRVGSLATSNIVRWDGAAWHAMGSGLSGGAVSALTVFQGQVIAGGAFTNSGAASVPRLGAWDGANWNAIGGGIPYGCRGLASVGGLLYELDIWLRAWNGQSWVSLSETTGQPWLATPTSIAAHDGSLFAIGVFGDQYPWGQGADRTHRGRWTGASWEVSDPVLPYNAQFSLLSRGDELIAAPLNDTRYSDDYPIVRPVRRWDGTTWRPAGDGFDAPVQVVRKIGSGGYMAAGLFTAAGASLANGVAMWNGAAWAPMDAGLPPPSNGTHQWSISDAIVFQGQPILAGTFTAVGGDSRVGGVVGWNGSGWGPLGTPGAITGSGAGLALFQGNLAAAVQQGSDAAIWLFDGADWTQVPGLLAGFGTSPPFANTSSTAPIKMVEFQGNLIVAGRFTNVAGIPALGYAKWDGVSWSAINTGGLSAPSALAVHAGALYAANGPVWRWDGASWTQVPSSASLGLDINSLLSHAGELWAGTNNGVVRFDGIAWRQAGVGQTWPGPYSLEEDGDDVLVGGGFISVGDRLAVAELARWSHVPRRRCSVTPSAASAAAPTLQSTLVPFALSGAAPYSDFRLIRNGVDLHAPSWPTPGRSFSVNGLGFMIDNPLPTDGGDYQIAAINPCGSTISTPVHVTVTCTADFDGNGRVDVGTSSTTSVPGSPQRPAVERTSTTLRVPREATLDIWRFLGAWFSGC